MVRQTTKTKTAKGKGNDGTTARVELSVSRVIIQSPRSTPKTTKSPKPKAKPTTSTKTSTPKQAGKKRTK